MVLHFNVKGESRKAMVKAIEKELGVKARYLGVPSCSYEVGNYTVGRNGELEFADGESMEETAKIIDACVMVTGTSPEEWDNNQMGAKEADCEPNKGATAGETAGLTVSIPIEKVKVGNLTALIDSKAGLIKKSLGITDLGIEIEEDTHTVFNDNVAQIRVTTSDTDVYDTITISKLYDGAKGDKGATGSAGSGGLSVVLGNETQAIACTSAGKTSAASTISIPFTGYVGITQTATTCAVGTLPTGITLKTNTAATATAAGLIELSVAASSNLGADATLTGNITLTFTISGKTVAKVFTWTKSKAGSNGTSAVVFSVYAPNGTIVQNQSGKLTLATSAYSGTTAITSATYQWAKYVNGTWTNISGATASTLEVSGSDIVNIQSYRCTMTYSSKTYVDVITVEDKSDPYVSEMLSIGGFTVKNNLGGLVPYVIVRTNQQEVDELKGIISETAPSTPKSGDFWYKIDHSAKTVTLMKYNGTAWANATEKQSLTYTWYAQDKDGKEVTFTKTGKVIYLSAADIDSLLTLQCDVSN